MFRVTFLENPGMPSLSAGDPVDDQEFGGGSEWDVLASSLGELLSKEEAN